MAGYKNPEMNKAVQKLKEAPRAIKITGGSVSTEENFSQSSRRAGSMTSSGLPRTTSGIVGTGGKNVNPLYNAPVTQTNLPARKNSTTNKAKFGNK